MNAWLAREDSNLQPDRYERSALTIELRARSVWGDAVRRRSRLLSIQWHAAGHNRGLLSAPAGMCVTRGACGTKRPHAASGGRAIPESVVGITFVRSHGPIQVCMRSESPGAGLRRFFDLSSYLQSVLATARSPQAGRQQRFHAQMENRNAA